MNVLIGCLKLFYTFFKVGLFGFGGGYAMMSMIMTESANFGVSIPQLADLNALDMIVPGPIAINAASYVGYLSYGFWGSLTATIGVVLPSFFIIMLVMKFLEKFQKNRVMSGFLSGVKPGAVGLITAASFTIAAGILLVPGTTLPLFFENPVGSVSLILGGVFLVTAVANIRFQVNPILLTLLAGVFGAIFVR